MPNDYTFDRFDFTETIEKYLARCQAEREGIAIETLRAMLPRRFVKSRAAIKRAGIKHTKLPAHQEHALTAFLETTDNWQSLAGIDDTIAALLDCEVYKPIKSLSDTSALELFPVDIDEVTKHIGKLLE